jgi:uncharacterized protein (TIGR03067 family)
MGMKPLLAAIITWSTFTSVPFDKSEVQSLDGDWVLPFFTIDGRSLPEFDMKLMIEDDNFTFFAAGEVRGTIRLDPEKNPAEIMITYNEGPFRGRTIPGIYDVHGDTLRIRLDHSGQSCPKKFESGDGDALMVLKRVKP